MSKGEGRAAGRRAGTPGWALTPSHRPADLRTRWALAWMGLLLGAACILLLLLLKKEDLKGERGARRGRAPLGVLAQPDTSPPPLPAGWLKSLRAGYGNEGEQNGCVPLG